jgi:ABC-type antimicrobial peptide transport system permease subunit
MWLVIKHGLRLAVYGVCLGALGASVVTRLLSTLLYKVSVVDPFVFASIAVLLLAVAMLASYLPAYRATKVDAVLALRSE